MTTLSRQRVDAPVVNADPENHRRQIAQRANASLPFDGSRSMTEPLPLEIRAVADLPGAAQWEGSIIFVPDEVGGAIVAFSDGTNWRRVTDRAVVA